MRRTVKRKNKKQTNGGTRKFKPTKCQTQRTHTPVSKLNSIKLYPRQKFKIRQIAQNPTSEPVESLLKQIIKQSQEITFVSADSLYALIFKMIINEGIEVGGRSITEFIMKLCVISPEGILYPRTWFRSEKRSYDIDKFHREYDFLFENSQLGICPKPIYYSIFDILSHKEIFELLIDRIPNRDTYTYLNQLWKDLKKVKSKPSRFTKCGLGIILMEFIPGESAKYEIDRDGIDRITNMVIVIKILYKLILLYLNGFIHLDCHLKNIIMRPDEDNLECVLEYPEGDIRREIAIALSRYNKTAILIDFGDVAPFEEVFPDQPRIQLVDRDSMIGILQQIMGTPAYDGWFGELDRPTLDSLISETPEMFDVLFDYYQQNTPL